MDTLKEICLSVMEDLSGVRSATETVRRNDRCLTVSWPYYGLQNQIEYKACAKGVRVVIPRGAVSQPTCVS